MTIAVDLGRKAIKQTNKQTNIKMHILGQNFISISLALGQKSEDEKWPFKNSARCSYTLLIVFL